MFQFHRCLWPHNCWNCRCTAERRYLGLVPISSVSVAAHFLELLLHCREAVSRPCSNFGGVCGRAFSGIVAALQRGGISALFQFRRCVWPHIFWNCCRIAERRYLGFVPISSVSVAAHFLELLLHCREAVSRPCSSSVGVCDCSFSSFRVRGAFPDGRPVASKSIFSF